MSSIFIVSGKDDRVIDRQARLVKTQIAFYASTPSYRKVFASQGYEDVVLKLSQLVRAQQWNEIQALITDEILAEFAVVGRPEEIPGKVKEKYAGVLDGVIPYLPFNPGKKQDIELMPA